VSPGKVARKDSASDRRDAETGMPLAVVFETPDTIAFGGWRTVDYNSEVEAGMVLAQLDDSLYAAKVMQDRANLAQAEAALQQLKVEQTKLAVDTAEANYNLARAKLEQARVNWQDVDQLRRSGRGNITDSDYHQAKADYETGGASLAAAELAVKSAREDVKTMEANVKAANAAIDLAKHNLAFDQTNLDYCTIRAPVKGKIVDRRVNVGQTVVASLQAPSLFLLAKDLTRMQIWASVNEADVGAIHTGQRVTFKIDAYPGEVFEGRVSQVRLNASNTQNVVIYTVVVNADNSSGKLLPYLTANMQFEVDRRDNVLLVSNAALRYRPPVQNVHPDYRKDYEKMLKKRNDATPGEDPTAAPARQGGQPQGDKPSAREGIVWEADGAFLRPIHVETGLTNGAQTEVVNVLDPGVTLDRGTQLVIGENPAGSGASGETKNPFATDIFKRKKAN